MIRAVVLDVDGVIVGDTIGYNSPDPHPDVISRLASIHKRGIPVILCTGKPHYAVEKIIRGAGLSNPHITNGGSVVIDPINGKVLSSNPIERTVAAGITDACITAGLYTEVYDTDGYYIARSAKNTLTDIHTHILQRKPVLADDIMAIVNEKSICKICPVTDTESSMPEVDRLLSPFADRVSMAWSIHPIANPHRFLGITARGISKRQTTLDVLALLGISPGDALAVGDSASDIKYMDLTGYAATVANGEPSILAYVRSLGTQGIVGGHVDQNGILSVFDAFGL